MSWVYGIVLSLFLFYLVSRMLRPKSLSTAVIQKDARKALLGEIPLVLTDVSKRNIYLCLTCGGDATAYTMLDDVVITVGRTWCELNGHSLYFTRDGDKIYVSWGNDLWPA